MSSSAPTDLAPVLLSFRTMISRVLFGHPADQDQPEVSLRLRCLELAIAAKGDDRSIEDRAAAFESYVLGYRQTASTATPNPPLGRVPASEVDAAHGRVSTILLATSGADRSAHAWSEVNAGGHPADEVSSRG
ncbi:hypothetical protein GGR88_001364 [Sphingomonas jejuensis]|uniref:Uncharacterized protein n=1 Tax=Sphingomonas jejuensis TaxID=904715 RepID=A0ABX0XMG5_9SPHN|nr:hypothetical protein [Sphingomonas jejuensis]NJC33890.1 hypothetical protein [Sphingomonas jejuensis]